MTSPTNAQLLTLAGLAHRCSRETERFFRRETHDPSYCFELFRRAIVDQNDYAWHLIYEEYRPLVTGWVDRHSASASTGEEIQYLVNRAMDKMWSALTPDKFDRFPDLKSVLRYLQMCVHSVIMDHVRRAELVHLELDDEELVERLDVGEESHSEATLDRIHRQGIWSAIEERLKDERERAVLYGSFVLGLKPRELAKTYKKHFRDVKDVYRVKENLLARLRRDTGLRQLLDLDA